MHDSVHVIIAVHNVSILTYSLIVVLHTHFQKCKKKGEIWVSFQYPLTVCSACNVM